LRRHDPQTLVGEPRSHGSWGSKPQLTKEKEKPRAAREGDHRRSRAGSSRRRRRRTALPARRFAARARRRRADRQHEERCGSSGAAARGEARQNKGESLSLRQHDEREGRCWSSPRWLATAAAAAHGSAGRVDSQHARGAGGSTKRRRCGSKRVAACGSARSKLEKSHRRDSEVDDETTRSSQRRSSLATRTTTRRRSTAQPERANTESSTGRRAR